METIAIICSAIVLDLYLGEPRRYHPLVGFGRLAQAVENRLYPPTGSSRLRQLSAGALGVLLLLAPAGLLALWLASALSGPLYWLLATITLYLALGHASLGSHARRVAQALRAGDKAQARWALSQIVSRDTAHLDEREVSVAALESVLENGSDAVFAAIFWFAVAGLPGVVCYRLANTLDAMWGYKNARYLFFGRAGARLDDLLNIVPAQLCALSYALAGATRPALRCWWRQGWSGKSLNAGSAMAAGAGALQLRLGGGSYYGGEWREQPILGCGAEAQKEDIERSLWLVERSLWLWLGALTALYWSLSYTV